MTDRNYEDRGDESGMTPTQTDFIFKERGQRVIGDVDYGPDHLGMEIIAWAFAEMIAFKDTEPPFAVGIFGRWGRGKSFFFELIIKCLIKIQKMHATDLYRSIYVGHLYLVKFDSWTFSKACIWSSLMYQILKALNDQLQFEEKVGDKALIKGRVSTLEVLRAFSKRELSKRETQYLKEHEDMLKDMYESVKEGGDRASRRLVQAIDFSYRIDAEKLNALKQEMKTVKEEIEKEVLEASQEKQKELIQRSINSVVNIFGKRVLEKIIRDGEFENLMGNYPDDVFPEGSDGDPDGPNPNPNNSYDRILDLRGNIKWFHKISIANLSSFSTICWISLTILIVTLYYIFPESFNASFAIIAGLFAQFIPVVTSISTAAGKVGSVIEELKNQVEADEAAAAAAVASLESQAENGPIQTSAYQRWRELKFQKEEIENRFIALEGSSLQRTVSETINSKKYENNLGLVHKAQKDIQLISDSMLNSRQQQIFPRGEPRIVLFVDDLDRCEPNIVVGVIEALQLLVKTKLFVVVLAIDPRYVTLCLEKHYEGILHSQDAPTGMDFLEKMVQLPFRLPGVEHDYIDTFVDGQLGRDRKNSTSSSKKDNTAAKTDDNDSADEFPTSSTLGEVPKEICFDETEIAMMKDLLKLFGVVPRSMKRIINVFKVLQVIWQRDSGEGSTRFSADFELKRAILFVMLLASEESTRHTTYQIFEWMELGTVHYHHVMCNEKGSKKNNLANLFKQNLLKENNFELAFSKDAMKQGSLMKHVDEYLSIYCWENCEEWKIVSQKFFFARTFSFNRLAKEDSEIEHQLQGIDPQKFHQPSERNRLRYNYFESSTTF